jgi:Flavin reductase like domain
LKPLPLSKVYQLLEPGPVVLLTTARKGRANVMTMSWHMMTEFEPPLVACVCSSANYSFDALRATGECVIAVPARTWRCQPCQERVSLWSSPSSFLAVSKLSSIAQR